MKILLKKIVLSLIVMCLFFLALEIGWRIKVTYETKNTAFLFYGKNFFELKIKTLVNRFKDGMRSGPVQDTEMSKNKIIWTFGGSTTRCTPFVTKEWTWPARLQYQLVKRGYAVKVVNKAGQGFTCEDNMLIYKRSIFSEEESPDLTIFYQGINDSIIVYDSPAKSRNRFKPSLLTIINTRLMDTSLLYASIKEKYYVLRKKNIDKAWSDLKYAEPVRDIGYFVKNLNSLINMSNDLNANLLFCAEPIDVIYWKGYDTDDMKREYLRIVAAMESTAAKRGVPFIDMNKAMFNTYKDFGKHYVDNIHLGEEGNDLVAQYLADYIIAHGLLSNDRSK